LTGLACLWIEKLVTQAVQESCTIDKWMIVDSCVIGGWALTLYESGMKNAQVHAQQRVRDRDVIRLG